MVVMAEGSTELTISERYDSIDGAVDEIVEKEPAGYYKEADSSAAVIS